MTTLIHGAGLVRNTGKAWQLFNEIPLRNLVADTGIYNALITILVRTRDIESALSLMDEMVEKHIELDSVTYHTVFLGLMRSRGIEGVSELYQKMTQRDSVPKTRTVVMLIKYFCQNYRLDLALGLWKYLLEKGYCPHAHALDLLVTGLCSRGLVQEAFECSKQMLDRGRHMSSAALLMLERFLLQAGNIDKLKEIDQMIKNLQSILPPSRGHATVQNPILSLDNWRIIELSSTFSQSIDALPYNPDCKAKGTFAYCVHQRAPEIGHLSKASNTLSQRAHTSPFWEEKFSSAHAFTRSYYDEYKGIICHIAIVDGVLRKGDKISSVVTVQSFAASDVGLVHREITPAGMLLIGLVGNVVSSMRSTKEAHVGDTIYHTQCYKASSNLARNEEVGGVIGARELTLLLMEVAKGSARLCCKPK
ncbi:hypothetical protein RJT34_18247 [Clitoria ternatea]|uniref:Pentatricopeptide repeat-containing protein n=1 Tax=Clitoria ternatea TaxID=43366 RepID=A0AAN9PDV0_CLITE